MAKKKIVKKKTTKKVVTPKEEIDTEFYEIKAKKNGFWNNVKKGWNKVLIWFK